MKIENFKLKCSKVALLSLVMEEKKTFKKGKGGRKPLKKNEKKNNSIMLRFNDEEHLQLIDKLKNKGLNTDKRGVIAPFLRSYFLGISDNKLKNKQENIKEFIYQINRIGNNINQITYLFHLKNKKNQLNISDKDINIINENMMNLIEISSKILKKYDS
ncbi:hypothetical protein FHS04_002787 [Mesoflavibacter sabulilitoris]|uniref:Bacterial mobilisation domain-containing protein n=1 Tax=Mesoflavibacter zeaxanthinifaciens subsp. sabulilitoris TaxID=1520893 RepID=A0A2T1NNK9_9FLAO|nr:hypothetical protein [Mesoflavibacter zeaxanthinifaciens]MBB3125243.1 hypothetical protein [Mesoflavibacter zeaxanthinifaciens subsp. sabulilitoris]PSG94478.1 hypothetical protein C7H61_00665 [Mesoflavibacter zeaxanthinifaciens subsp. sabulilitoris]